MKEILIGGYYGGGNLGDEAILAAILQDLRNLDPSLNYSVVSWDPHLTRKEHEVGAVYWRDIEALVEASRKADLILVGGGGLFQDHWGLDPDTYLRVNHGGIFHLRQPAPAGGDDWYALHAVWSGDRAAAKRDRKGAYPTGG